MMSSSTSIQVRLLYHMMVNCDKPDYIARYHYCSAFSSRISSLIKHVAATIYHESSLYPPYQNMRRVYVTFIDHCGHLRSEQNPEAPKRLNNYSFPVFQINPSRLEPAEVHNGPVLLSSKQDKCDTVRDLYPDQIPRPIGVFKWG